MSDLNASEAAGIFGGVLTLLGLVGGAIAWLLNYQGARSDRKAERMRAWEESLLRREREYRENIENELAELRRDREHDAVEHQRMRNHIVVLRDTLSNLVGEVKRLDPTSAALARADRMLRAAFTPDFTLPADMAELLMKFDEGGPP